ncbi:MAG: hypothetical protein MJY66_06040 [Bacteroidaceae bacterium]|nr:hypothetical protein [Bacteroidaceae bacterium]
MSFISVSVWAALGLSISEALHHLFVPLYRDMNGSLSTFIERIPIMLYGTSDSRTYCSYVKSRR